MLEMFKLKTLNLLERISEKKLEGMGVVFVPTDLFLREVGEALLIDGALPSDINEVVLNIAPEITKNERVSNRNRSNEQIADIRRELVIEGADEETIKQVVSAARKELSTNNRRTTSFVSTRQFTKVNLSDYAEP